MVDRHEIDELLPLPPATFHILLAVAGEDRHGYAIIQDVAVRTGGELKLSAGTLYRLRARPTKPVNTMYTSSDKMVTRLG